MAEDLLGNDDGKDNYAVEDGCESADELEPHQDRQQAHEGQPEHSENLYCGLHPTIAPVLES